MTEVKITNVPGYCRVQIKGHAGYGLIIITSRK